LTSFSVTPIKLYRSKVKFVAGAYIDVKSYEVQGDAETLRGLPSQLSEIDSVEIRELSDNDGPYTEIIVPDYFPPGSVMILETQLQDHDTSLDSFCTSGAAAAFGDLNLVDLNVILHRAEGEERDATDGKFGAYEVPGLGKMTYCGLEGWMHPLRHIMRYNDLGHALCGNLRAGTWAMDYVHARLFE
jgi:glycogen debranching enzyme